jgi:hypothetical protein
MTAARRQTEEKKPSFYWKTATPAERARELKHYGDKKTAIQDIKIPCCICERKIKEGEDYRVFHNNNVWKGHETCVMSGGIGVRQVRGVVTTESGEERIFWDQLTKKDRAVMLLKRGVTFTARTNTPGLCTLCGRRFHAGETLIRNASREHIAHKDEAERMKLELEAENAAKLRQAEKTVPTPKIAARMYEQQAEPAMKVAEAVVFDDEAPAEEHSARLIQDLSTITNVDVEALVARIKELEKKVNYLEGFREAVYALGGVKVGKVNA